MNDSVSHDFKKDKEGSGWIHPDSSYHGADSVLRNGLIRILNSDSGVRSRLQQICDYLHENIRHCDWAGYYLVDPSLTKELFLGPYSGEPTEHTKIEFGNGICGQAASTGNTLVIADVKSEANYLSCSPYVKSEIVVPVFHEHTITGEIDLDSFTENGFSDDDRSFLEWVAEMTSELVEKAREGAANN